MDRFSQITRESLTEPLKYYILDLEVQTASVAVFIDTASDPIVCSAKGTEPTSLAWLYSNGDEVGDDESSNTNSESVVKGSYSDSTYSQTLTLTLADAAQDQSYTCKAVWNDQELTSVTTVTVIG